MKKQVVAAGFVIFSFMLPLKASAASFSQIIAFGDSTVDNGNTFKFTEAAIGFGIPPLPYFQGRFSNGPVWVEYLAGNLGLTETNYAFGGATTSTVNTINTQFDNPLTPVIENPLNLPGLTQQIEAFKGTNSQADKNALYIISAGANDYLGEGNTDFTQIVNNLTSAITSLASIGAKNFLVANLPNLGDVPLTNGSANSDGLNFLTGLHNSTLSEALNGLNQQQPSLNITLFDVNSLVNSAIALPGEFGLQNVTDACFNSDAKTLCNNPDEYLFWDQLHPTTYMHSIVARGAEESLKEIPEPSATLGMLALGALGATGVMKRKQKALNSINRVLAGQSSRTTIES
ncbi:SGNH/GDSL hydrolase family protein [Anabaena cylindrica FACHB-243]|uniref:PEP motif putative anchor domain protein n=1 Tax=Anabaena cylindrica (strain ATCC 27899 / PCC 7122) TaxID=272123 RepID=K9ZFL3_ANACC|nr:MULTISPECIES: SGNH/GDSL hydrolase family protein [Anabaena]AFZ57981.1 PEP motif putative anchor domain protein [Anabaena cylindrica PCC 7122]MBD2420773.1 SGNH/GDSL hydrolase family protein [Anabaena cylindrica FACHB-243]MBY5282712.1 SGNH/GDSL hydrolase family protein [Anabaena sp. CCAP 1446/1C]MBY5307114.1 SGNH/GDSL hydrolase family protein [Anabaena sp. CCAP 1446/1C]MCM2408207.1 SGNH/GDSL hydrolase family protein [Anabaena sp. CCAP 1446/1C]